ncbi:hypothetical protein ACHWQZ_G001119 [Mnemiopsis leidyi]
MRQIHLPLARTYGTVTECNSESQFDEVFQGDIPTLIDFHADWCGPCKILTPTLKKVIEDHAKEINLLMVNVDQFGDIAHEFDVSAIPCVKLVKEGKVIDGFVGVRTQENIEIIVNDSLGDA